MRSEERGLNMVVIASILILLSLLGVIFGLIGVLKGSVKFLKLKSRKASSFFILGSFIVFIISIMLMPTDSSTSQVAEKTSPTKSEEKIEPQKIQEEEEVEEEKREEEGA